MGLIRRQVRFANPATFANAVVVNAVATINAALKFGSPDGTMASTELGFWRTVGVLAAQSLNDMYLYVGAQVGDKRLKIINAETGGIAAEFPKAGGLHLGATYTAPAVGGLRTEGLIYSEDGVDVASGKVYKVNGTQVVGAQGAAVADPTGGMVVDTECRAQLSTWLARARTTGLIAT